MPTTLTPSSAADLFRSPPDRLIDVGGSEVAHRVVGDGPDVLFVHGWPVNGATFRLLLPHLVDHVRCHLIDLPGTGSSRFSASSNLTIDGHIESVRRVVDALGVDDYAVVGHDSGGMIARHAVAGDERLRAVGLVNTELSSGLGWRFRMFLAFRNLPGLARTFGIVSGSPRLRRNKFLFGDAFADRSGLDGEFDEFFLAPLHEEEAKRTAAVRLLRSFDTSLIDRLADVHARIDVPVHLVWGVEDPFFPVADARGEVATFPDARMTEIEGAGLFVHEEAPAEVAAALLPTLST